MSSKMTGTQHAEDEAYAKLRFLATKGFSTKLPSSLIFSRAFSAAAALPDCAPPDSRCTISVCNSAHQTLLGLVFPFLNLL